MIIPPFYNFKFVDDAGMLTHEAQLFMASLNQYMQGALSDSGWTVPQQGQVFIDARAADTTTPNGTIWFNTSTSKLNVKTASGVIEVITST